MSDQELVILTQHAATALASSSVRIVHLVGTVETNSYLSYITLRPSAAKDIDPAVVTRCDSVFRSFGRQVAVE